MLSIFTIAAGLIAAAHAESITLTPHVQYSSSIGVPGCHVDVDRIAYFPMAVDCNNLCLEIKANGRSVNVLHIDTSGGAYDISYDAWNYLMTGAGARENAIPGDPVPAEYSIVPMSNCQSIIKTPNGKLPITALNPNYQHDCPAGSFGRDNTALYNFPNMVCSLGFNEQCTMDHTTTLISCPHTLGAQNPLGGLPVYDLEIGTGKEQLRTQ